MASSSKSGALSALEKIRKQRRGEAKATEQYEVRGRALKICCISCHLITLLPSLTPFCGSTFRSRKSLIIDASSITKATTNSDSRLNLRFSIYVCFPFGLSAPISSPLCTVFSLLLLLSGYLRLLLALRVSGSRRERGNICHRLCPRIRRAQAAKKGRKLDRGGLQ